MTAPVGPAMMQTAFVVADIHTAMAEFGGQLNAGPWHLRERSIFDNQIYRGEPVETELSIAMAYSGDMLIELIQQHDDAASVYHERSSDRRFGLHHFGVGSDDYERDCARYTKQGHTFVYQAEVAHGARVGYFELPKQAFMIEVIELKSQSRAMFASFREAHATWNGLPDIRSLPPARRS